MNKRVLGRSIEERPVVIDERTEFGHWEIDIVIGKKSQDEALMTLTERKTRQKIIMRLDGKGSESITVALRQYAFKFAQVFKTIISDIGSEFANLVASVASVETDIFFTQPNVERMSTTTDSSAGSSPKAKQSARLPKRPSTMSRTGATTCHGKFWTHYLA